MAAPLGILAGAAIEALLFWKLGDTPKGTAREGAHYPERASCRLPILSEIKLRNRRWKKWPEISI
jgi:hypothetical protein